MKNMIILTTSLLFSLLTACNIITGEGPIVEKTIELDAFTGVEMDGSFDLVLDQGVQQKVVVAGNQNILDRLKLEVLDNRLYISLEPGNYMNFELEVRVTLPTVDHVSLSGSGDVRMGTFVGLNDLRVVLDGSGDIVSEGAIEVLGATDIEMDGSGDIKLGVRSKSITIVMDGSGDVELTGSTTELVASLDGSGDIKAHKLESLDAQVKLDGSGSIEVHASKHLKAELSGSGDISYRGEPKVEASIDGSGTVSAD